MANETNNNFLEGVPNSFILTSFVIGTLSFISALIGSMIAGGIIFTLLWSITIFYGISKLGWFQ